MTTTIRTTLNDLRLSLPLRWKTPSSWVKLATSHLDQFLADHASCERKASAAALMLANRYPEYPELQERMIALAVEELQHFHQVFKILIARQVTLTQDEIDPYVKSLLSHVRHPRHEHLLDRLLVAAMIEARSCERFCLFAEALPMSDLKHFYETFAIEESAHYPLFLKTAELIYAKDEVSERLDKWLDFESEAAQQAPLKPTVH